MKSAYELAMERLDQDGPKVTYTEEQKAKIAEVESLYTSKIAEREVFLSDLIAKAMAAGNFSEVAEVEEQKRREIARLEEKREDEKEKIRRS